MPVLGKMNPDKGGTPTTGELLTGIMVRMCRKEWDR